VALGLDQLRELEQSPSKSAAEVSNCIQEGKTKTEREKHSYRKEEEKHS
jgi:hypothetical protein